MTKEQEDLFTRAKLILLRQMPYFGTFIIGMDMVEDTNIPTAATDYYRILYNPNFVMGGGPDGRALRDVEEVLFILAHEVLHISFKHGIRQGFRDPKLWNVAADYAINLILHDGEVGKFITFDPQLDKDAVKLLDDKFRDMSAETIYDLLEKERQKQGGSNRLKMGGVIIDLSKDDPGGTGGFSKPTIDGSDLTPAQREMLERAIDSKTSAAAAAAKSQGKLPAGLERFLKTAMEPVVDWRSRLRQFVAKQFPADMSWARPNRRFIWQDLYLPYQEKSGVGKILFIMDTSGSVDYSTPKSEGAQYYAEGKAIHEDVMPEELHVMYCDAKVAGHDVYRPGEDFILKPRGGGGTDFRPPFKKVKELGLEIQCAIYLTDMVGTFPDKPPPYPVLWVATTDIKAPFGETIRIMK